MNSANTIQYDENLSEELLSEDVSPCKIRSSKKILVNMGFNSLSNRKKFGYLRTEVASLDFNSQKDFNFKRIPIPKPIKPWKSPFYKQRGVNESLDKEKDSKQPGLLKREISSLLKQVSEIKQKTAKSYDYEGVIIIGPRKFIRDPAKCKYITMKDVKPS
ncbi:unnamed protein product [Moneuplotes crassus]|uniref:Uncharacterized protein n=1 Tax=Euplotes crassus TaxID=5936 RepID=A0AAD2CZG5_EUPCR|nr:unnamed protein product [Moneuplotes crassus]